MHKWIFGLAGLVCLTFNLGLSALLPPLFQTADEIRSVLNGDQLGQILPAGEPILEIRQNPQGYELYTNRHRLQVEIIDKANSHPGPRQYEVRYHNAELLESKRLQAEP